MAKESSLPSIQDHARTLMDQAVKDGKVKPVADAEAALAAASLPSFSKGTVPLDSNGKPITIQEPPTPSFSDTTVSIPEGTETTGTPQAVTPAVAEASSAAPAEPVQAQAGAAAAEQAAAAITDTFGDYDEIEIEEPDFPDVKIPVRVQKQYSQIMKRAIPRRADYDRMRQRLGEAEPILGPMLQDGRIKQVLPLIQWALTNREAGDFVWGAYQRSQQGLPLVEQATREAAAMGQSSTIQIDDPYVGSVVEPLVGKVQEFEKRFQTWEQQQEQQRKEAAANQQRAHEQIIQMQAAHNDLAYRHPGVFDVSKGAADPAWIAACNYAREHGYIDTYGLRGGIVFGGDGWRSLEAERLAATASPAAAALSQMNNQQVELARRQASQAAQTVGAGATTTSAAPPPPQRPTTTGPDGKPKPINQYLAEQAAWLKATGQIQ